MTDTPARLLQLLSLLQTPREWPGSELARRLEVTPRTIRRDIDRLRELGYPVEATMGATGGYRLVAGSAMPPLLLDDDEAVAIAIGLRAATGQPVDGIEEAAVRALTKLAQVLPSRLRHRVRSIGAATDPLTMPPALSTSTGAAVDAGHLTVFAAAIANRERVRFRYTSHDGDQAARHADPVRLVPAGRRWYLLAFDHDRDDWRTFRVDRITRPQPTGARSTPHDIPGGDAAAFVQRQLFSSAPTYTVVATLRTPVDDAARRFDRADLEPLDAHSCRLHGNTDTLDWIAVRLILLGADFEVHDPPELRSHLHALGARLTHAAD